MLDDATIEKIGKEFKRAAREASTSYFKQVLKGEDGYPCGFSWITVKPEHKGNTRLGREERRILERLGFEKDWTGKNYQIWNPGGYTGQNVDAKSAGSRAAEHVLRSYGFRAGAGSRLD